MGVVECAKHMVVEPFPVLYEKDGEVVAQIKSTVLMMPNGPLKITGVPVDLSLYDTENKIEDEDIKVCEAVQYSVDIWLIMRDAPTESICYFIFGSVFVFGL